MSYLKCSLQNHSRPQGRNGGLTDLGSAAYLYMNYVPDAYRFSFTDKEDSVGGYFLRHAARTPNDLKVNDLLGLRVLK